jgi:DNA-directed RNA polymerase specialized sigma24 family protein
MASAEDNSVSRQLDTLVRLVALLLVQNKSQQEQCLLLSRAGFQPKEIASVLGTTPNTVSVTLSASRRAAKATKQPSTFDR